MNGDNPQSQTLYTAGQLQAALGVTRQAVFKALAGIPAAGQVAKGGRSVNAWGLNSLPGAMIDRLRNDNYFGALTTITLPHGAWGWRGKEAEVSRLFSSPPPP